jgi:acylphosphatase
MKQVILKIYGDVQGVSFRWRAKEIADKIGIAGWVRNEPDGAVKVVAEGEEAGLKDFIKKCYTIPSARVEKIDDEWEAASGEFEEFEIKY